jgi:hypothetical protein
MACYQKQCPHCKNKFCQNPSGMFINKDGYCSYYYELILKPMDNNYYETMGKLADTEFE